MATNSSGTTIEIAQWLRELGLEQYTDAFHENAIDEKILPTLNRRRFTRYRRHIDRASPSST